MMFIFTMTYLIRWIGDYFVVPKMLTPDKLNECTFNGDSSTTLCVSFEFIIYCLLSSLVYDFLPIFLIVIFHFLAFRIKPAPAE